MSDRFHSQRIRLIASLTFIFEEGLLSQIDDDVEASEYAEKLLGEMTARLVARREAMTGIPQRQSLDSATTRGMTILGSSCAKSQDPASMTEALDGTRETNNISGSPRLIP